MAKKPVFDFGLGQSPRVREKQAWLDVASDTRALGAAALENARLLALDRVEPGPWQVRRAFHPSKLAELVESVRAQGVLEPILVRPASEGRYQIIAGERRYRAAREAGLVAIPALVLELDDVNARVVSLMENIQRDDLNEVERADGLIVLKQITGQTWEEIGRMLGITKRHVLHLVSLTRLPLPIQDEVRAGRLSAKHGRLLAYVKQTQAQMILTDLILELRLNAQQTAAVVKRLRSEPGFAATSLARDMLDPVALRNRVEALVADSVGPFAGDAAPARHSRPSAPCGLPQLFAALADARRALAAFPGSPLAHSDAALLRAQILELLRASQAVLAHLPEASALPSAEN